jgi:hypothetical protein
MGDFPVSFREIPKAIHQSNCLIKTGFLMKGFPSYEGGDFPIVMAAAATYTFFKDCSNINHKVNEKEKLNDYERCIGSAK